MPTKTSTDRLASGHEVADWIQRHCTHTKGEWAGRPLELQGWQRDEVIVPLFGTLGPDGRRRYRTALIGIPRKAGKSTLGAAIALRLLFRDSEPGAEVYSAAADREQAAIVFEMARGMVEANPAMSRIAKVYRRSIVVPRTGSSYKVLSADAYTKHGLSPHGVVFDELHAQPDRELWDVLTTGQGARRQPLTVAITTAGYDRASICYELYTYGRQVNAGVVADPTFFFRWWGVDADAGEAWDDEGVWERAQPNLGVSVSREFLRAEARQAKAMPARQNTFRRLYLNEWTASEARWFDLGAWDACGGLVDAERLRGQTCYAGLDLASTSDFTAWVLWFPDAQAVLPRFWLPRAALERRSPMRDTLIQWQRRGWLEVTDGDVVDQEAIYRAIDADATRFRILDVGYDRWNADQLILRLAEAGMTVSPVAQTFAALSPAAKELERRVLAGELNHGGNPVLRWMADNTQVDTDATEHIKPSKKKSSEKIDGIVALVNALERWMADEPPVDVAANVW